MDQEYFTNYCGHGPYEDNYLFHSGVEHCISIFRRLRVRIGSVAVLGAATGQVLDHFEKAWGVKPWGCEISEWAWQRIPARHRRRMACADLRDWVPDAIARGRRFDLIFSNSLVYLPADEIPEVLAQCAEIGGHFHFWSSTSEDHEKGDAYRVTLKPATWWKARFADAGFEPTRSPYVFRSAKPVFRSAKPAQAASVSQAARRRTR